MKNKHDRLIDEWLDGDLTVDEGRELNAWLTSSSENAHQFAERSQLHSRSAGLGIGSGTSPGRPSSGRREHDPGQIVTPLSGVELEPPRDYLVSCTRSW